MSRLTISSYFVGIVTFVEADVPDVPTIDLREGCLCSALYWVQVDTGPNTKMGC